MGQGEFLLYLSRRKEESNERVEERLAEKGRFDQ
jgi:hypothetical protein